MVSIQDLKANLSAMVAEAESGDTIERVEQDTSLFVLRDLTLDLCQSNLVPAVTTPRSLDLAHLRSALWFHAGERIDRFVTMDGSQEQAARELGLPV